MLTFHFNYHKGMTHALYNTIIVILQNVANEYLLADRSRRMRIENDASGPKRLSANGPRSKQVQVLEKDKRQNVTSVPCIRF